MIPNEIICYELGDTFGIAPWEIEAADYDLVMKYWEVHQIRKIELQKAEEDRQHQAAMEREMAAQPDLE